MSAEILYGAPLATKIKDDVKKELGNILNSKTSVVAIHNSADQEVVVYMNMQRKECEKAGIKYQLEGVDNKTTTETLTALIRKLNKDINVAGITVHLPLPPNINKNDVINAIAPEKDVEGMHPYNLGMLAFGEHYPSPCAARAGVELLKSVRATITGLDVTIVGRSPNIGKPLAYMLLENRDNSATPTLCHTKTRDLTLHTKRADAIFAVVGKAGVIKGNMVKAGAIVIDIGTNVVDGKLVGDVAFDEAKEVASFITPVPGGVGPVTLSVFLKNICECIKKQKA